VVQIFWLQVRSCWLETSYCYYLVWLLVLHNTPHATVIVRIGTEFSGRQLFLLQGPQHLKENSVFNYCCYACCYVLDTSTIWFYGI